MYTAKITRENPALLVFLVDQSGSMGNPTFYEGNEMTKAECVATIINSTLEELSLRCRRGDKFRNYFNVAVYGYHDESVTSLFDYIDSTVDIFTIEDYAELEVPTKFKYFKRVIDGVEHYFESSNKRWIDAKSEGSTPTFAALTHIHLPIERWCSRNKESYPPILVHISDGMANDATEQMIIEMAQKLKRIRTKDGKLLFFNIHLSCGEDSMIFPLTNSEIIDRGKHAALLHEMSSAMPEIYYDDIAAIKNSKDANLFSNVKAMAYNCSISDFISLLNIGTSSLG